jgi:hypothetical protein
VTFRVYDDVGADGYPPEWHSTLKHQVRSDAGNRCVRCGHPYTVGGHGTGEWSPCDPACAHRGPVRYLDLHRGDEDWTLVDLNAVDQPAGAINPLGGNWRRETHYVVEAHWRILTVHHLDGDKRNCRWWNLAALCQRCHLTIQGRVVMARVWPWEHSKWFRPYVAGYYAAVYLGEDLDREQTLERLDELLALERVVA